MECPSIQAVSIRFIFNNKKIFTDNSLFLDMDTLLINKLPFLLTPTLMSTMPVTIVTAYNTNVASYLETKNSVSASVFGEFMTKLKDLCD